MINRLRRENYEHYANDETSTRLAKKTERYSGRTC